MIIVRDTREQNGFTFSMISPPPQVEVATLETGDYSLRGLEDQVTIERKSLADAFGSFGKGRRRFERELERMAAFQFAAVIIESDWQTIFRQPPTYSRMNPKSVLSSVIAWSMRYRVHFWACPDRIFAERITYRLLERFWKDYNGSKK